MASLAEVVERPEAAAGLTAKERTQLISQMVATVLTLLTAAGSAELTPAEDADKLMTMQEVAGLTGFPKTYCYELARAGRLPVIRQGKYVRVRKSSLLHWIDQSEDPALLPLKAPRGQ